MSVEKILDICAQFDRKKASILGASEDGDRDYLYKGETDALIAAADVAISDIKAAAAQAPRVAAAPSPAAPRAHAPQQTRPAPAAAPAASGSPWDKTIAAINARVGGD